MICERLTLVWWLLVISSYHDTHYDDEIGNVGSWLAYLACLACPASVMLNHFSASPHKNWCSCYWRFGQRWRLPALLHHNNSRAQPSIQISGHLPTRLDAQWDAITNLDFSPTPFFRLHPNSCLSFTTHCCRSEDNWRKGS